ncbi:MAG TPA: MobQ family relaxase [Symbiobacteriaceae bacterium]|nr:MobQ family relaxase [Symbiobacteriaceae bacterium]
MAIFYMNVKVIGRSAGRTATGAAAYRAGERIHDERTGLTFDYTKRRGEMETEILAPAGAPEWVQDRSQLWNRVEEAERRADAQVAREIVVAFPKELTPGEQRELIRGYVQEEFVSRGMVADVAIHRNPGNPHAHIMLTMREIGPEGFSSKKNREWNRPDALERWREQWAVHSNRALERAGQAERVDHRSLAEQGLERLPQVHLGPHASALERRGVETAKGNTNRLVQEHNGVVIDLEHARAEKQRLLTERVVDQRYKARISSGWPTPQAQAVAQIEYYDLGGRQMTFQDAVDMRAQQQEELQRIKHTLQEIRLDGKRLDRAEDVLKERRQAAANLKQLKTPFESVKRLFSSGAREELRQAEMHMANLDKVAAHDGVKSDEDFKEQRARWQRERAKGPGLEESLGSISKTLERLAKAVDGFQQEQERDMLERMNGRRNNRGRDDDYDRGR